MATFTYSKGVYEEEVITDGEYRVYEPGSYDVEIVGVEESLSDSYKTQGQIKWKVRCRVVAPESEAGGALSLWLYPESGAKWRVGWLLSAIGIAAEDGADQVTVDTAAWIGRVIRVVVRIRDWRGEERNEVTKILPSLVDQGAEVASQRRADLKLAAGRTPSDEDVPFAWALLLIGLGLFG